MMKWKLPLLFASLILIAHSSFSQENSPGNHLQRYLTLESHLYKIPVEKNVLLTQIMPAIEAKKLQLAIHFPAKDQLEGPYISQEQKEALLQSWISSFPSEYTSFISYLENLVRSYH